MGFSRQEYWSGLPFPSPGHLPDPGIEPRSPALQADSLLSEPQGKLHSFTHFPPVNSNSSFQLLRPKRWESHLTLFSPHTTFDLAANATGSIFKTYPTLTLSHDLHIYEHCCVPPSPPAWTAIGASLTGLFGLLLPYPSSSLLLGQQPEQSYFNRSRTLSILCSTPDPQPYHPPLSILPTVCKAIRLLL